jgi:hypothetical protein
MISGNGFHATRSVWWYLLIRYYFPKKVLADVLFDLIGSKDGADFAGSWGGCLPGVSITKFWQN